jgi:Na+/H+-dicarboxylate symporter
MVLLKKNPKQFIASASNALITAFATSSSMATLPVTLLVAKEQNISDDVARFVLPLATTINLAGTAMYEAVSALFFCQILGFDLSIAAQIGVFLTAILAGMGATGIPEGGLITMVMVLRNVNVPTSAIGLLLPFDRILDRFRTMTNVWGDLVCAATVDHLEKRKTRNK